jgi:hypothetical protein
MAKAKGKGVGQLAEEISEDRATQLLCPRLFRHKGKGKGKDNTQENHKGDVKGEDKGKGKGKGKDKTESNNEQEGINSTECSSSHTTYTHIGP